MDPFISTALIGAGSNLLSNIFGASSNRSTNKTNLKINQMNNDFNERMMQKQMDYNTLMWEKQNEYNNPINQVARLRSAGLNPAMMLGSLNAGNASSVGSTSAASAATSAPQQPFRPNFEGIPQAILQAKQGKLIDQQSEAQRIDNLTKMQRNLSELTSINLQNQGKRIQNSVDRIKSSLVADMEMETLNSLRINNEARREEMKQTIQNRLLLEKELSIFDEQTKLEFAQMAANTLNTKSQSAYTKQQQVHEIQKMYETMARRNGIKISNDVARRTAQSIVDKAYYEAYESYANPLSLTSRIGQRVRKIFE